MAKNEISSGALRVVIGISFILFAIMSMINIGYVAEAFVYIFVWAFGFVGYWFVFPFLMLIGLYLIFKNRFKKINFGITLIGLLVLVFSFILLFTNLPYMSSGIEYINFGNFIEKYSEQFIATQFVGNNIFNSFLGGGALGYFLVGSFNTLITPLAVNIISIVLGSIGILLIFNFVFVLIFRKIAKNIKNKKTKKVKSKNKYFDENKIFDTSEIEAVLNANPEEYSRVNNLHNDETVTNINTSIKENNVTPVNKVEATPSPIIIEDNHSNTGLKKAVFVDEDDVNFNDSNDNKELKKPTLDLDFSNNEVKSEPIKEPKIEEKPTNLLEEKEELDIHFSNEIKPSNTYNPTPVILETEEDNNPETISEPIHETPVETEVSVEETPVIEEPQIEEPVITESPAIEEDIEEEITEPIKIESEPVEEQKTFYTQPYLDPDKTHTEFKLPDVSLLDEIEVDENQEENISRCEETVGLINNIFEKNGVLAKVVGYTIGPSVTQYDVQVDDSVLVDTILKVQKTISVKLGGIKISIETIVEGKTTSAIIVPNKKSAKVKFKETFLALPPVSKSSYYIPFGKNISGENVHAKFTSFPHFLVAGTSGSGKSVYVNSVITTLIMRNTPEQLRLILIDPKRIEFSIYKDIPHLLCPVITDTNLASPTIKKLVAEMERRYLLLEMSGCSDIDEFNEYAEEVGIQKVPTILAVLDEFGNLVEDDKTISEHILKLAAKARAAAIHLLIATQRPSVNVITGTIKANLDTRVCLSVSSSQDSQVVLDKGGAENLCGNGDMLVSCTKLTRNGFVRAQGCLIEKSEIRRVCEFLRKNNTLEYDPTFVNVKPEVKETKPADIPTLSLQEQRSKSDDELYNQIKSDVMCQEYTSMSRIQREYNIGFNRAGKMMNRLVQEGIVAPPDSQSSSKGSRVLKRHSDDGNHAGPGSIESSEVN